MTTTFLVVKNRAHSKLAAAITAASLSLTVTAGEGANFPSTYPFHITIDDEILAVTNRSTDTLTVTREAQGTTAAIHANKSYVALNITAQSMTDLNTAVNTLEGYFSGGCTFTGAVNFGVDDTGVNVIFYGATSGSRITWNQSTDELYFIGTAAIHGVGTGALNWPGDVGIGASLTVIGNCAFKGATVGIDHSITVNENAVIQGNIELTGTLRSVGAVTFDSTLSLGGTLLTVSGAELNFVDGVTSAIQDQINAKSPIASPTFTGTVTLPTGSLTAAPLKFVSGVVLTTPVAGTMEFVSDTLSFTITSGAARKTIAFLESPAFTTPNIGVASATSVNGLTLTAAATGFTIAGGTTSKTLTVPLDASVSGTNTGDNTVATSGDSATSFFASGVLEVGIGGTGVTASTGTVAVVLSNTPTLVTPILGVASATSLATSAAIPLLLTYGQLVNISLTSQTVGATTLTIPNFASVSDTFVFTTLAQELSAKTLNASIAKGTWTTSGTWTLPALTLGGTITGGSQNINALGAIGLGGSNASPQDSVLYWDKTWTVPGNNIKWGALGSVNGDRHDGSDYTVYMSVFDMGMNLAAANTANWTAAIGMRGATFAIATTLGSTGTVTGATPFYSYGVIANAAAITNYYGIYVDVPTGTVSKITNLYGIYIADMAGAATKGYGIVIAGADNCVLWLGSGADNTDAANGIFWGASQDTNLYRSAANALKTDDTFSSAGFLVGATAGVDFGPAAVASITVVKGIVTAIS